MEGAGTVQEAVEDVVAGGNNAGTENLMLMKGHMATAASSHPHHYRHFHDLQLRLNGMMDDDVKPDGDRGDAKP